MWEGVKVTRVLTWVTSRDEEGLQWGVRTLGLGVVSSLGFFSVAQEQFPGGCAAGLTGVGSLPLLNATPEMGTIQ